MNEPDALTVGRFYFASQSRRLFRRYVSDTVFVTDDYYQANNNIGEIYG